MLRYLVKKIRNTKQTRTHDSRICLFESTQQDPSKYYKVSCNISLVVFRWLEAVWVVNSIVCQLGKDDRYQL